jgi:transposase
MVPRDLTVHPEGYAYSRFCQLFREFERRLSPTMRQQHAKTSTIGHLVVWTGRCS